MLKGTESINFPGRIKKREPYERPEARESMVGLWSVSLGPQSKLTVAEDEIKEVDLTGFRLKAPFRSCKGSCVFV